MTQFQKGHQINLGRAPWNKGKGSVDSKGYRRIQLNGKSRKEHHIIWCLANNMWIIPDGCEIHHRDQNKLNNHPDNLILLPQKLHASFHHPKGTQIPNRWKNG